MTQHEVITEFESIAESRKFSFILLALTTGFTVVLMLSLADLFGFGWLLSFTVAYTLQFILVVWCLNIYLKQSRFDEYAQGKFMAQIAGMIRKSRLTQTREELEAFYGRDSRIAVLLGILSFLLDGSDFLLLSILKYFLLACLGVILLPYSFVANAPLRYLGILSESRANRKNGYTDFLVSTHALGFFMFAISASAWLVVWWLYSEFAYD